MNVVCIIQARLGSSRLPGKSLRSMQGQPMIYHVIGRALHISGVDRVVLATSTHERDDALAHYVSSLGDIGGDPIAVFRGSEHDVLTRYAEAARAYRADVVMRVTGDCPFIAPEVCEEVVKVYLDNPLEATFVSNDTTFSGYPDGMDVEVFSRELLDVANDRATELADREHVTRWMRRKVCTATLKSDTDWSQYKISVDTPQDWEFAVKVAERLPAHDYRAATTMRVVEELYAELRGV